MKPGPKPLLGTQSISLTGKTPYKQLLSDARPNFNTSNRQVVDLVMESGKIRGSVQTLGVETFWVPPATSSELGMPGQLQALQGERWLGEFEHGDEWSFWLAASKIAD